MRFVKAIVPAAGLSSRFGGPNKMLADWNGRSVVRNVVDTLVDCDIEVLVVTGRDAELVEQEVRPARCVFNAEFASGLGSSLAAGVSATGPCNGFLIALGDMPNLRAEAVRSLIDRFESAPEGAIVAPVYSTEPDRLGHPIVFCASYRATLEALSGDAGARSIIQANRDSVFEVACEGELVDLDVR